MTDQTPDAWREELTALVAEALVARAKAMTCIDIAAGYRRNDDRRLEEKVLAAYDSLDTYAAAVSRSRDAAWREAVEAVRTEYRLGTDLAANGAHAALDALLARMAT